jgi:transposase-like protein
VESDREPADGRYADTAPSRYRQDTAARLVTAFPQMSDRAVAEVVGLTAKTVAAIRRSIDTVVQPNVRVGRDGRARPVNSAEGRLRAAALLSEQPQASLREVARLAGVSPATVQDVRRRLESGEEPVPARRGVRRARAAAAAEPGAAAGAETADGHSAESDLLRLLERDAVVVRSLASGVRMPASFAPTVVRLAYQNAQMWLDFALKVDEGMRMSH